MNSVMERQKEIVRLPLTAIRMDGGTQSRAELNEEWIDELVQVLEDGISFEKPAIVYYDGTDYWLADGFHRFHATKRAGRDVIESEVRQGTQENAIECSCGANATHGLRRTNEDKRRAVERLLKLPKWENRTQDEVAKQCGVSQRFVSTMFRELFQNRSKNPVNQPVEPSEAGSDPRKLRVTNKDKQITLEDFFASIPKEQWDALSNVEIAGKCGVTEGTVRNYRKELHREEQELLAKLIESERQALAEMESQTAQIEKTDVELGIITIESEEQEATFDSTHAAQEITAPPVAVKEPPAHEENLPSKVTPPIVLPDETAFAKYQEKAATWQQKEQDRGRRRDENREKIARAPTIEAAIAVARFSTIVIDPPWDWGDEGDIDQFGRARPAYETMSIEQLLALPVGQYADEDCHLYLWITNRSLPKGFRLLDAWGFRYITCVTWVKPYFGMGNYFRGQTEQLLFGVKGSQPLKRKDAPTYFKAPRGPGGHSSKPLESYAFIESCSPAPYLELFARSQHAGWTSWGGEI